MTNTDMSRPSDWSQAAVVEGASLHGPALHLWLPMAILLAVWGVVVLFVDPIGEFMVNDDWSFVRSLDALRDEGRIIRTGWGPGGPALITHLFWALGFTKVVGYSLTALRVSVLVMGIAGSMGLLILLRLSGASRWLALWGTLTLVFNPLFLSQSFTFMTDITFVAITVFSVLCLYLGAQKSQTVLIVIGMVFALLAILTRQIGIVIPLGFCAICFLHPKGRELGRLKIVLLALGITLTPWVAFEVFLASVGSTPVTDHDVIHGILRNPLTKGFYGYLGYVSSLLFGVALGYSCFLVSPVLALSYRRYFGWKAFRHFFIVWTAAFALFEAALFTGLLDPPVLFHRNVIFDFGIGPIMLKDTYVLGIQRTSTISKPLFYLLVYWAVPAVLVTLALMASSLKDLLSRGYRSTDQRMSFLGSFCLITALIYMGIILLTGFHDRYLIPVCMLFIVWLVAETRSSDVLSLSWKQFAPAVVPFVVIAVLGIGGVRDFMETKRSVAEAHQYLVTQMNVAPCHFDGGFEFNGYHCCKRPFEPRQGMSWWWVEREDYVVTLGPLPGYRIIKTFPFDRYLGPDGASHILQPLTSAHTNHHLQ